MILDHHYRNLISVKNLLQKQVKIYLYIHFLFWTDCSFVEQLVVIHFPLIGDIGSIIINKNKYKHGTVSLFTSSEHTTPHI